MSSSKVTTFFNDVDFDSFVTYYKSHTDNEVYEKYNLTKSILKRIKSTYKIKLTNAEKHSRFILNCYDLYGMSYDEYKKTVMEKRTNTNINKYGEHYRDTFTTLQKQTMLDKYGVENPSQVTEFREKVKQTNLERFGAECNLSTDATKEQIKQTCLNKYGVEFACQSKEVKDKIIQTNLDRYGVENVFQNEDIKEKSVQTCIEKYGVEYISQNKEFQEKLKQLSNEKYGVDRLSQTQEVKDRTRQTNLEKYGVASTAQAPFIKQKIAQTNLERYGNVYAIASTEIRKKIAKNSIVTSLEKRMIEFLTNNGFEYKHHYLCKNNSLSHDFDFAIYDDGKLIALIDCDGIYYHGYISDINGKTVNPYPDDYREQLVPDNVIFLCCVENNEEDCYRDILKLKNISYDEFIMEIFNWCKQYEFPYPEHEDKVLLSSYKNLCNYSIDKFTMNSKPGMKIIEQFHKSIWKANKYGKLSPYDAWTNDELLLKSIKNRIIYKGCNLYPSKVLGGFTYSQIAPRVSVFNPYLSKYLVVKYLSQFSCVFDPCSGYSGRMLGVCSLNKQYIGQDINATTIEESRKIIEYLNLDAKVSCKDLFEDEGNFDCLLTCPPYSNKESWGEEVKNLSCDEWIDEILKRYTCKRYVFVVDNTNKYKEFVREELLNKSHFGQNVEYVIVIDKGQE